MGNLTKKRAVTLDIDGVTTVHDAYMVVLDELIENVDLDGVVFSSADGLAIASVLRFDLEEDYIAAICANALRFVEQIGDELKGGGKFEQLSVKIGNNLVVIIEVCDDAILIILANGGTKFEFLPKEIKKVRARIDELLNGELVPLLIEAEGDTHGV